MRDIDAMAAEKLRRNVKQRYGLDLDSRIKRVEFENTSGVRAYFSVDDAYEPPRPPEPPRDVWEVRTSFIGQEPETIPFDSENNAQTAFKAWQGCKYDKVELLKNGEAVQQYERSKT